MQCMKKFTHIPLENVAFDQCDTVTGESGRFYSVDGIKLPSVTTVTGYEKRQFFAEWRRKNPKESARVLRRGNELHDTIEKYLKNEWSPAEPGDLSLPTLDLFKQLQPELDNIDNIYALEVALWSQSVGLAGRVDCIAEHNGELSVIDFKGSTKEKRASDIENYFLQATAYALMFQEKTGIPIPNIKILIACENCTQPQVFEDTPMRYVKRLKEVIDFYHSNNQIA